MTPSFSTAGLRASCWIGGERADTARVRLFCFPFAGGAASLFRDWSARLPADIAVFSLQLPGRENRIREAPHRAMPDVVDDIVAKLEPWLDEPLIFFGYSLGALIAFETARELRRRGRPLPRRLFIASSAAPHCRTQRRIPIHRLPFDQLIHEIRRTGGTPEQVLRDRKVMETVLPMIRADFEVLETYRYEAEAPLSLPITAYGGLEDPEVPAEHIAEWGIETATRFQMQFFPGWHFILKTATDRILADLAREASWLAERNDDPFAADRCFRRRSFGFEFP